MYRYLESSQFFIVSVSVGIIIILLFSLEQPKVDSQSVDETETSVPGDIVPLPSNF